MADSVELLKRLRLETGAGVCSCQKALKETNNNYDEAVALLRKQGAAKATSKADRVASDGLCGIEINQECVAIVKLCCETDFVARNEKFQSLLSNITKAALEIKESSVDELLQQSVNGQSVKDLITDCISTIGENIVLKDVKKITINSDERVSYYIHNKVQNCNLGRIISLTVSKGCNTESSSTLLNQINMHIAAMSPIALDSSSVPADVIEREKSIYEEQVLQLNKPKEISEKMIAGKLKKFYEENVLLNQIFVIDNKTPIANVIANFNKENGENLELVSFFRISI